MNAQQFLTWMRNPGQTSREESAQLDALLDAFPYFQSGHLLYIKNLHNQGSFLYNNQLKTAAAYAVNRKVLYELITLKSGVGSAETRVKTGDERQEAGEKNSAQSIVHSTQSGIETAEQQSKPGEDISEPIRFPPKKFTNNPDEWEAGMLRQLQLLHHWKQKSEAGSPEPGVGSELKKEENRVVEPVVEKQPEVPAAKDEINTLLYVLVEPGQSEDLAEEATEETVSEISPEEPTSWEIKTVEEKTETPVAVPTDPVQQEIIVEAIHSTFELEVDDKLPSVADLQPIRIETKEEPVEPKKAEVPAAETVVTSFENMSFSDWLKEVNRKVPAPLPKTALSEDKLVEDFIRNEPRINVKKSGFYNPVNMAKKSVQESDEFITETLARIYAKQGNHTKAIRAYQKLSLKFPEKTAYFAALIEELKRTPNK